MKFFRTDVFVKEMIKFIEITLLSDHMQIQRLSNEMKWFVQPDGSGLHYVLSQNLTLHQIPNVSTAFAKLNLTVCIQRKNCKSGSDWKMQSTVNNNLTDDLHASAVHIDIFRIILSFS